MVLDCLFFDIISALYLAKNALNKQLSCQWTLHVVDLWKIKNRPAGLYTGKKGELW